jgi:hypothetical protein
MARDLQKYFKKTWLPILKFSCISVLILWFNLFQVSFVVFECPRKFCIQFVTMVVVVVVVVGAWLV